MDREHLDIISFCSVSNTGAHRHEERETTDPKEGSPIAPKGYKVALVLGIEPFFMQANNKKQNKKLVRVFATGANRDIDIDKLDFEGFYSPIVMQRFAEYMHKHRKLADGTMRPSDNWQLGIPKDAYIKSAFRHFHDWWMEHRGYASREGLEDALCGVIFNAQGYLFEVLKNKTRRR